ncbi:MAG: SDR family oxidoreductase [Alphaproteobacteria bacterium]
MGDLAGKTVFITGASRGIGKAIALGLAADGANIVIVAKTAEPHPKLPGTIFTAADEIEAAGGKALPVACDIRDETRIAEAVERAVTAFGGIDILINNASALTREGTLGTTPKRFDLMMDVNTRGTFLCTRACLPHLEKAANPHILVNAPPLVMERHWFVDRPPYTVTKFGMSLLAHGWAGEFAEAGIAVNCLWPRTLILSAALAVGRRGEDDAYARKPAIMADAAQLILRRDARECTGNFFIDEIVLREAGVTDFEPYAVVPGHPLKDDLFLPEDVLPREQAMKRTGNWRPS